MFGDDALRLYDRGWLWLTPIWPGDKRPAVSAWPDAGKRTPTRDAIARLAGLHAGAGVGLVYGPANPTIAMDLDILDMSLAGEARAICEEILGYTPLIRQGRAPKLLLLYRKAETFEIAGKFFGAFECFSRAGSQTVIGGIHPDTGRPYEWIAGATPMDATPEELPTVTPELVYSAIDSLGDLIRRSGYQNPATSPQGVPKAAAAKMPAKIEKARRRPRHAQRGASDRTSGAMAAVLPKLRDAADPLAEAARLASTAGYGSRYATAFGLIGALVAMGYPDEAIELAVIAPYLGHFGREEIRAREHAIGSAFAWARSSIGADDHFRDAGAAIAESLAEGW
jgi:hypothetical protein